MSDLTHVAALADEMIRNLGAVIADPGPGQPRTLTTPTGQTLALPPRCECWACGPHPDRTSDPQPRGRSSPPTNRKEMTMTTTDPQAPDLDDQPDQWATGIEAIRVRNRMTATWLATTDAGWTARQHINGDVSALLAEIGRLRRDLDTMTAVAASNKRHAQTLTAVVEAAYRFADDMADFTSPFGVATRYAQQLREALDRAKPTGGAA